MAEHKRKRLSSSDSVMQPEEVRARFEALKEEMDGMLRFYREVMEEGAGLGSGEGMTSQKGAIACLMEESELPLSKLVEMIHARLKEGDGNGNGTVAVVKSVVVAVGQRVAYGVPNPDADVLEDESPSCLWCWEV